MTSEEAIKNPNSEVKNDAIRSDKEKADEEPINLLSASEHNSNDSNMQKVES